MAIAGCRIFLPASKGIHTREKRHFQEVQDVENDRLQHPDGDASEWLLFSLDQEAFSRFLQRQRTHKVYLGLPLARLKNCCLSG